MGLFLLLCLEEPEGGVRACLGEPEHGVRVGFLEPEERGVRTDFDLPRVTEGDPCE